MKKLKRIAEIFKILDIKQVLDFFIFPFIFIISIFAKPFCKDIWIVAENENEACDNGYIFFKYLRENRKDINAYYVIKKNSKDYEKVSKLGNVIHYRSLKHWIYYLNAKRIVISQKYSNPSTALFYLLHIKNIIKTPRIYLNHGITKDNGELFYYNRCKFRIFTCGAKREYDYLIKYFGYPKGYVKYTGFARFDNLDIDIKEKSKDEEKYILVAPTWRKWFNDQNDFDEFMEYYYRILDNEEFKKAVEDNNIKIHLVLHKNMRKFKIKNEKINDRIVVNHNDEVNIQDLINKTDLLLTDFSSIFFDIAYRKRPMIFYQFDTEKYRKEQLQEGYFSYEKDGFGEVIHDEKDVIKKLIKYIDSNFKLEKKYEKRMDDFFERKDKNNCKRILEEIEKI